MEEAGLDSRGATRFRTLRSHSILDPHRVVTSRRPRLSAVVVAAVFGVIASAAALRGQTVRARVLDASTQRPIVGVSVYVADVNGVPARSAVTDDSGRVTLHVPADQS